MHHFIETHGYFVAGVLLLLIIVLCLFIRRWHDREQFRQIMAEPVPATTLRYWRLYRYMGGGHTDLPEPMTEAHALQAALEFGSVMHVDREHGFIFYRPKQ